MRRRRRRQHAASAPRGRHAAFAERRPSNPELAPALAHGLKADPGYSHGRIVRSDSTWTLCARALERITRSPRSGGEAGASGGTGNAAGRCATPMGAGGAMTQHRIDALVAVLARDAGLPRRALLRRVVAVLLGGGLVGRAGRAAAQPGCRGEGHPCEGNQEEMWGCCAGLYCADKGEASPGNARRCVPMADLGEPGDAVLPESDGPEEVDAGPGDNRDGGPIVNTGPQLGSAGNGGVVDATTNGGAVIVGDVVSGSDAGSGAGVDDEEPDDSGG